MILEFGEWLPDLPALGNPGALEAKNVYPHIRSYRPVPSLVGVSDALDEPALGAYSAKTAGGNTFVYVGTASKLYELVDGVFTDVSKAGGYSTGSGDVWEFTEFNGKVIATNFADPVQFLTVGGGGSGNFANLITSTLTPKARHLAVMRNFLVLGNTNDATDGNQPGRVWWSAFNDETDFDPDAATQSDYEDIEEGGAVQRLVGGTEYGVVLLEKLIYRMYYVGPTPIWNFNAVDRSRGTQIPNSVIAHGRNVYYRSEEGFHRFDGVQVQDIGTEKVDKTFDGQFDVSNKLNVSAAIDPPNHVVCWAFPGSGSAGGLANRIWFHNWSTQRWSEAEIDVDRIFRTQTQGYTLDGLDAIGTDIDDADVFPESFDSDTYKGGKFRFAAIGRGGMLDKKMCHFTGANLAATVDTGERQLIAGHRALICNARPLVDGGTPSLALGVRDRQQDGVTFNTAVEMDTVGKCPQYAAGRYHRGRLTMPAGETWTHAQGVEIEDEDISDEGRY